MNYRSTTPSLKKLTTRSSLVAAAVVLVLASPVQIYADQFDRQINQLKDKINSYQSQASELSSQADTLENTIAKFNQQIANIQAQIELSELKRAKINKQIELNKKQIELNKQAFADTLGDMYVDGTPSAIEILASSSSITDFVNKQAYRQSINDQLEETIARITNLQKELTLQKKQVEETLADQNAKNAQLAAKKAERNQLLKATQGREAEYQNLINRSQSEIAELRAEQAAAMAAANAASNVAYGSSSYPWPNKPMNYNDVCQYPDGTSGADIWGYCYRQCTSFVAWKLANDGRGNSGFAGLGDAGDWAFGGTGVSAYNAQPGDVVIWYVGEYGHVMYVEWVNGSQVGISQFNAEFGSGIYSTATYDKATLDDADYDVKRFH